MNDETVNWTEFREFAGVDLEASFILSWSLEAETLHLDIDLHLLPEHAFYEMPRPSQKACIRAALVEFPHCDSVHIDGKQASPADVASNLKPGRIDGLSVRDGGRYELWGEFGNVQIDAERPLLRLKEH